MQGLCTIKCMTDTLYVNALKLSANTGTRAIFCPILLNIDSILKKELLISVMIMVSEWKRGSRFLQTHFPKSN